MPRKGSCRGDPIHELGITGRAIGMSETVGRRIHIVSLTKDLLGHPGLCRRLGAFPDQSTDAANGKNHRVSGGYHASFLWMSHRVLDIPYGMNLMSRPSKSPSFTLGRTRDDDEKEEGGGGSVTSGRASVNSRLDFDV